MKTYLQPQIMRRASPVVTAVSRERSVSDPRQWLYILHTFHDLSTRKSPYEGAEAEYNQEQGVAVSREFYTAFLKESRRMHKKYSFPIKEHDLVKTSRKVGTVAKGTGGTVVHIFRDRLAALVETTGNDKEGHPALIEVPIKAIERVR